MILRDTLSQCFIVRVAVCRDTWSGRQTFVVCGGCLAAIGLPCVSTLEGRKREREGQTHAGNILSALGYTRLFEITTANTPKCCPLLSNAVGPAEYFYIQSII